MDYKHFILGTYPPWSWVPVRVVVSLFGALVATAVAIGVLSGVDG